MADAYDDGTVEKLAEILHDSFYHSLGNPDTITVSYGEWIGTIEQQKEVFRDQVKNLMAVCDISYREPIEGGENTEEENTQ